MNNYRNVTKPTHARYTHVVPLNDLRDHVTSEDCWCKPTVDAECDWVMVHNSMDRREEYEQGRRYT